MICVHNIYRYGLRTLFIVLPDPRIGCIPLVRSRDLICKCTSTYSINLRLDGYVYPLEMHLVHFNNKVNVNIYQHALSLIV